MDIMWNGGKRNLHSGDLDSSDRIHCRRGAESSSLLLHCRTWHRTCSLNPGSARTLEGEGAIMKKEDPTEDAEIYLQPAGIGGQLVPPADGALFVPDDKVSPDDRGVDEEGLSEEDEGLLDAGQSPEFDHSLRNRKPSET